MTSDRIQRQIDRLLDEAEAAIGAEAWETVAARARSVLRLDSTNADARAYLDAAEQSVAEDALAASPSIASTNRSGTPATQTNASAKPDAFANGRYAVKRFLGEGGKKKVYLAHDSLLDRDVAFALIKTEGLDEASRTRISREAQAMGRLGDHPNIVTVYDIGSEGEQPYMVLPVLAGGDVEGVIEKAPEQRMPMEQALKIAIETCKGLEFAHGKGIVHRDLKPGNVWLSEDGTAKIGDFGLAVAMDKSRLTQAGMMVGTVSYMPPEQAMGGEVGPRSDLYSLGAMLYEMVCGRPPFVGDESVAIIGQHLNTPPVAPSWHRPDCPPAMEGLILRLLEKDPGKRPANATEVRTALEGVSIGTARPRDPTVVTEVPAGSDNPLYRRTFVGRENEVRQLQQSFDQAMSGNGALVMVVGEPGIGKTAICEQLATYVALRGGKALVGHCYEEGSLSLPYLAFVEAMRSYVLAREPDGLRSDLGSGAAEVARIVSEVRDRVQGVELRPAGDPEDDRWRLLQAVTSFLRNASSVQPLCIVVEDLHWADRGTLDLLLHVARNLQGTRLLLVGTYRDVEVDRAHPLSGTLAELRRQSNFLRVPLRGLTVDEVHRLYELVRGHSVPWAQAELIHRRTEGHPLFIQEVLRYYVEEGLVVRQDGRYVRADDQEQESIVPEGLREVVGRRLNRLGEKANQALSVAAVIGRDFRLDVLQRVVSMPEDELFSALEEAHERAILEQRDALGSVGFRFAHAFFRQTLYEEIFTPRRIRLHQQVGRALEEVHSRRLEEHAAELAEHFSQSTEAQDLRKAVEYAALAADRSLQVYAYAEAKRHLEQALRAQEVLDPDDVKSRCSLLLRLAEVLGPAGEPSQAVEVAEEAYVLAERLGNSEDVSRACSAALYGILRESGMFISGPGTGRSWAERADRWARPGTPERVDADISLGRVVDTRKEALPHFQAALELARRLNYVQGMFRSVIYLLNGDEPERLDLAEEFSRKPRHGVSAITQSGVVHFCAAVLLSSGEHERAEALLSELSELYDRTNEPFARLHQTGLSIRLALMNGDLQMCLDLQESIPQFLRERGQFTSNEMRPGPMPGRALWYMGVQGPHWPTGNPQFEELTARLPGLLPRDAEFFATLLLPQFPPSHAREVFSILDQVEKGDEVTPRPRIAIGLLEAGIAAGNQRVVGAMVDAVTPLAEMIWSVLAPPNLVSPARLLGDAYKLLGQPKEARGFYEKGNDVCDRTSFRPELALTRLSLAELLLEYYPDERHAAIEHLDFAIAELRDMKMQPALERALRHRGLLKA